ncbi:uncharacterized protein BYT42DRAFT_551807 [Radiomyces spectabilis]|uniref:uncharacterized protein n=1 Tax=Radiomyces spectabilis TaxID=64574 RepID=UPI00221F66DA|nr:uncharacterized protein BYT42DRAFT_551807 [Radiomyces spectabilis]KAI8393659.1 hypothetical protein BYT42DRAFT_551807 [Radiomyces spectabilis]
MDRSLLILYGSETGSAQDVAENIGRQARRRRFRIRVLAMDDYDKLQLVNEKLVIFVCSTSGQGDEPANMKKFWRFLLRKNLPHDILSHLDCAVFGLGDSSYRKFNYPSKKLYKRLTQLGANMLCERGDGDDQHYQGVDGGLSPWLKDLWQNIMRKYPLPMGTELIPDDVLLPPSVRIEFLSGDGKDRMASFVQQQREPGEYDLIVKQNQRITAEDHFQDVRHVILSDPSEQLAYEPGDVAVITPRNIPQDVDAFLELMGWTEYADRHLQLHPAQDHQIPTHWPSVMTFRDLFVNCLDIFGVPRRSFFEMLAYFTKDENHTERLREFNTPEGLDDMWAYCQRPRRTIAEVLFDFKPVDIPFDYMLDLFPPLQPRSFSIASSLKAHPNEIHLCVAIVKYKTVLRRIRRGVLTKWLSSLQPEDTIERIRIAKGTMKLPPSSDIPLIAIGPGTGIAPMRSFIEERIKNNAKDNVLFFGCRYRDKDYHYREEWEKYVADGSLTVFTAFSRDQEEKLYVQDRIRENASLVWYLIDKCQAKVILSGSADKMPKEVAYAFKQVFMSQGGLDAAAAEEYFDKMSKTGQYQEECWS